MATNAELTQEMKKLTEAVNTLTSVVTGHISGQEQKCLNAHTSIAELKETVYGKGSSEGLKTSHTKLSTRVTVIFGLLGAIGLASFGSLLGWMLVLISKGVLK